MLEFFVFSTMTNQVNQFWTIYKVLNRSKDLFLKCSSGMGFCTKKLNNSAKLSSGEFTLFEACSALFFQLLDGRAGENTKSLGIGSNLRAAHCQEVLQKTCRKRSRVDFQVSQVCLNTVHAGVCKSFFVCVIRACAYPNRGLGQALLVECASPLPAVDGVLNLSAELPRCWPLLVKWFNVL